VARGFDKIGSKPQTLEPIRHPQARSSDVLPVGRIRTYAGDSEQLVKLFFEAISMVIQILVQCGHELALFSRDLTDLLAYREVEL
jgi:hypothetical protein